MKLIILAVILAVLLIAAIWLWILKVIDEEITDVRETHEQFSEKTQKKLRKHSAQIDYVWENYPKLCNRIEAQENEIEDLKKQLNELTKKDEPKDDVQEVIEHFEAEIAAAEKPENKTHKKKRGKKK